MTVSHTPNTSRPGIFDFTGRAKWDSWQEVGAKYSTQSDPDGVAQARYIEIAISLGWKPGTTSDDDLLGDDTDGERESAKGVGTGMGVSVSTMSAPKNDDLDTIHGLAIVGDAQKLAEMLIVEPSLDLNRKDEYVSISSVYIADPRLKVIFGQGYTALHLACDRGNLAVVELLLKHGVDRALKASCSSMCYSRICAQIYPM